MSQSCDQLYDKTEMYEQYTYTNKQNGVDLKLRFVGLNEDPGQFEIESSLTDPLTGDNITFSASTVVPYSTNIMYDVIPFELLKTYETKP